MKNIIFRRYQKRLVGRAFNKKKGKERKFISEEGTDLVLAVDNFSGSRRLALVFP